jgi:hypothetical protein
VLQLAGLPGDPPARRHGRDSATSAATVKTVPAPASRSRGATSARNAAPTAASSPRSFGSERDSAPTAPISVARFQHTNTAIPVDQNARRDLGGVSWATAIAALSSIVSCAAANFRTPRTRRRGARRRPYRLFRVPSSTAVRTAATGPPPLATAPTYANWDPPLNSSSDSAHAWSTVSPALVAIAPNDRPYAPTARPTPTASRTIRRRSGVSRATRSRSRACRSSCASRWPPARR